MAVDTRLTVLLTLKGRNLYTLRWLWHANRVSLPFPVVVADGEVNPVVARLIEDRSVFPNLQIEYRRYNDLTFRDFYLKLQDAVASIKTPYVMMSDNDDFLFPSGIVESLTRLDRSPDYVSMGGGIGHFESRSEKHQPLNLNGKIEKFWYQQSRAYRAYNLESPLVAERVYEAYAGFLTVCYNVFRVKSLLTITEEIAQLNFQRLDNSELFQILRTATLGKVESLSSCMSYFRQLGTSSNPARGQDFIATVSNGAYVNEIQEIVKRIALIAADADRKKSEDISERLNAVSARRLKEKLSAILGWRASIKAALKNYVPQVLTETVKTALEQIRSGKSSATGGRPTSRDGLLQVMANAGASSALLAETQRELADVEYTMESGDFIAFVKASAPELLRQDERALSERRA